MNTVNRYATTDTQLKKLKTAAKNKIGTTLRMNLKLFDENNLPMNYICRTRQKINLRNVLNNNKSVDIKLSSAQIFKIIQSEGFLGSLLSKLAGPLMKLAVPLAKTILTPLGITAAASTTDARTQKKIHGSGTATLIISKKEINDIIKIIQTLENSNILPEGVTKADTNEIKNKEEDS